MNHPPTTEAEGATLRTDIAVHADLYAIARNDERLDRMRYHIDAIMQLHQLETAKAVQEARMQAAADVITQFNQNRINHTLSTPVAEWERELETADKTLYSYLQQLQKESE